jgi:hypothetical protein
MYNVKVGDGVTLKLWTDQHAYTVISRTQNTITIQRDRVKRSKDFTKELQFYEYKPNRNGRTIVLYWSGYHWRTPRGFTAVLLGRHEYYDFKF